MGKKIAEFIVEVLEQAGVKCCYGIVGDTLNPFTENLEDGSILLGNSQQPIQRLVSVAQTELRR